MATTNALQDSSSNSPSSLSGLYCQVAFARLWQQPALECLLKLQQVALSGVDTWLLESVKEC